MNFSQGLDFLDLYSVHVLYAAENGHSAQQDKPAYHNYKNCPWNCQIRSCQFTCGSFLNSMCQELEIAIDSQGQKVMYKVVL